MKWALFAAAALVLLLAAAPGDTRSRSSRSGRSSQLRRRSFESRRRPPARRHLLPLPPPRCHSDITRTEAVEKYDAKVQSAPYVFTGKVTKIAQGRREEASVYVDAEGVAWDGVERTLEVRIKRALKGDWPWSLMDIELTKPHLHKSVSVMVPGREPGEEEGEGDEARCRHLLRQNHTAILLAERFGGGGGGGGLLLQLVSNPLALTLRNLDKVNAAVKDISYKPRPSNFEEPCEKTFCANGASCVTDAEGRARCQCPEECPDVVTPVCGSDGETYANYCLLRKKACQDETKTRVQHSGECGAAPAPRRFG